MKFLGLIALLAVAIPLRAQEILQNSEVRRLPLEGFVQGPVVSPDGKLLAFSREQYQGVSILDLQTSVVRELCAHEGSGWGMIWLDNTRLLVRSTRRGTEGFDGAMGIELLDAVMGSERPVIQFAPDNRLVMPQKVAAGIAVVRNATAPVTVSAREAELTVSESVDADRFWVYDGTSISGQGTRYPTPLQKEILSLVWSPDGSKALVELLGRPSLYIFNRANGKFQLAAERGEHPSWLNDNLFVYGETQDDGHRITAGNIYLGSILNNSRQNLTGAFSGVAMNPTASSDGKVAFNTLDGEIYMMTLDLKR